MEKGKMGPAIVVQDLLKVYGAPSGGPGKGVVAVDGISFEVQTGEIFGMVGPNGAGKTSAIECIEGLRKRNGGSVSTLGLDPEREGYALRKQIGVQLQEAALPDRLKVWEAMDLFASFYPRPVDWQPLLDQLGLEEKETAAFSKLSGGQKQRLFIALALINDPDLVFLDELTTGLDPQARRAMWDLVRSIRERGKTVFLTTHYMEEAERLCDRVAILDHGRIVALDTPENLVRSLGVESRVVFTVDNPLADSVLESVNGVSRVERIGERIVVYGRGEDLVVGVVTALAGNKVRFRDLRTEQASLEDVFLALTGREMRE
jgi:ABC-2 type transport system ATP-binding protein